MNKIKMTVIGLAALVLAGGSVQAQFTDTNAATAENNFVTTAASWFSSIDYTKSWPTNEIDFAVGGLWQNNNQWANYLNVQKNFGNLAVDGEMDNAGVVGTIYRVQFGGGYRFLNRGDLSMTILLNGGYDKTQKAGFAEPTLLLRKIMAHGAFTEIALDYDVLFKGQQSNYPGLRIGTGFTF
jgi:hypothetical protein